MTRRRAQRGRRTPPGPNLLRNRRVRARKFRRAKWLSEMVLRSLGAKCATCGCDDLSLLTVDHVDGVTWDRYRLRYDRRVEKYIAELVEGVRLRCLCLPCNGRFGRSCLGVPQSVPEPGSDFGEVRDAVEPVLPDAPF